ncbi:F-box only protein 39-like isoform X2 [Pseudochaenichthys georgianus]|uniref:F-box only protein 39-like isoform X2 n=1 Tax=Pseudochaenichthys georgianus TaxID=52239 RepID=UPI00146C88C5|nr:F-box only protein 39-like isoform X2 [Pseudochaenichthys georgianus]
MNEELIPLQNSEDEDNGEKMEEVLSDAGCSSECWAILPVLCLAHVFKFLDEGDRRSADLVCQRWHNIMRSPSLWRSHTFHLNVRPSKYRYSEFHSSVAYVQSRGVYLERLAVLVNPPSTYSIAWRMLRTIKTVFDELTRVRASLKSISLTNLELDRPCWTSGLRNSFVIFLVSFLRAQGSKLDSVCLNGMKIGMIQGFFSGEVPVYRNSNMPRTLGFMKGLTHLSLSYSCLSDELLKALQHRDQGWRDFIHLKTLSLWCSLNVPHGQVICGHSWESLASCCPGLKVKIEVDQILNTDRLARILLPEIPLVDFSMATFYSPNEEWSPRPLFYVMLPQFRLTLKFLTLHLSNCSELLDDELLKLVRRCDRLEQLRVWAFLEVRTVQRLLRIRLAQRSLLNTIRVSVYSVEEDHEEQKEQLEILLSTYRDLPPELDFFATVYPYV